MTATTQEPATRATQQAAVKVQAAASAAPPGPAPAPGAGQTGGARRRGKLSTWFVVLTLLLLIAGGVFAWAEYPGTYLRATLADVWHRLTGSDVPEGFAVTHGRVEATKVYITTKYQGRIETVLVREGDTVEPGQILARMDTRTLKAQ